MSLIRAGAAGARQPEREKVRGNEARDGKRRRGKREGQVNERVCASAATAPSCACACVHCGRICVCVHDVVGGRNTKENGYMTREAGGEEGRLCLFVPC